MKTFFDEEPVKVRNNEHLTSKAVEQLINNNLTIERNMDMYNIYIYQYIYIYTCTMIIEMEIGQSSVLDTNDFF